MREEMSPFLVTMKEFDLNFFRFLIKVDPFHIDKVTQPQFSSESLTDLDNLAEKIFTA